MGLISLAKGVLGAGYQGLTGTLESAVYREYFESGDMSDGVLMKRAQKRNKVKQSAASFGQRLYHMRRKNLWNLQNCRKIW